MTSTPFNVGLNDAPRLSSRVLRPPGGGHTDIFSGEPEPAHRGRRGGPPPQVTGFTEQSEQPKATNGTETQNGQDQQPQQPPEPKFSEPKPEPAPVVTPTNAPEPPKAEPPRAEPPKRVRVPPGGFSSGLW